MSKSKHRVYTGALAFLFLLSGILFNTVYTAGDSQVLAEASGTPDVIVEAITLEPGLPAIGGTAAFTVTVRNQGGSPAGPLRLASFIDDSPLEPAWISAINPGATLQVTVKWKAQAGPHVYRAVADDTNGVAESDENNNEKTLAFSVIAPDLVIAAISWSPENPSTGNRVTLAVTVKNQGSQTATGFSVNLKIDSSPLGNREISALEVGANSTVTYTWLALSGPHTLEATADRLNQVKEGDETNNSKVVAYATAAPDIVIDSITWSPQNRAETSNVTMSVKISNRGSGKAGGFWVAYYVDDGLQTEDFVEGLKAGGSTTEKYSWIAGLGAHTFKAAADSHRELFENDETHNDMTVTLPAVLPDLIVQSITRSTEKSVLTDGAIIIVVVKNQGKNLSLPGELTLRVNDNYELREDIPVLTAGETIKILFNCITKSGTMTFKAVIDADNVIPETNEANNTKTVNIGPPKNTPNTDLTISSIAWAPTSPSAGDTVTITASIKNKGPGQAGYSHVDYYIDDTFLESVYADQIRAGKTLINTATWEATPGTHTIKAIADCDNHVAETSETNNEKTATIRVTAPDLAIQSVRWSPERPQAGDEVNFTVIVKNRGDLTSGGAYIDYYVDGVSQGRHYLDEIAPGDTVTTAFAWRAQTDSWALRVAIDEGEDVTESDESNNEKTVRLPAPDLKVESISWTPENPSENATVTFNIEIKNPGTGTASQSLVTVYANDIFMSAVQFHEIPAGETADGSCTWTAQSGNFTLKVIIDEADIIAETDENNNEIMATLSIGQAEEATQAIDTSANPEAAPSSTATANETELIKTMLFEEVSDNGTVEKNIADTSAAKQPWWQKILTNKMVIIAVGGAGMAALVVLMLLRRRSRRK